MIRSIGVVLCLLLAGAQDPADKVKGLIAKLGSEELIEREEAAAELAKLGPAAIPAIRGHLAKAKEELRVVLQKVVRRIERNERVAMLSRPGPCVTLTANDRPAAEVLAELTKQTGIGIFAHKLPARTRLSIDAKTRPLAAVIDDICRAHGGLCAAWSPTDVRIEPGALRNFSQFENGPFRFIIDRIEFRVTTDRVPVRATAMLRGGVTGPRGMLPDQAWIDIEAAEDDKGTDLGKQTGPGMSVFQSNNSMSFPLVPTEDRIYDYLTWHSRPAPDATRLKRVKGAVRMVFTVDYRPLVSLKDPIATPTSKATEGVTTFEIRSWNRTGADIRFSYLMTQESPSPSWRSGTLERPRVIALEDREGRRILGRCQSEKVLHRSNVETPRWEIDGVSEFAIPDGFDLATLDLLEPAETLELSIQFELTDVPLNR